LLDSLGREALAELEPSLASGNTKRRLRNLIDAGGLLGQLTSIAPRAATDEELQALVAGSGFTTDRRAVSACECLAVLGAPSAGA
jgi:hypothetical protein